MRGFYKDYFENIVILCPTIAINKSYNRDWIFEDDNVYTIDPKDKLDKCLQFLHTKFDGEKTLFIIDDCSANKDIKQKQQNLSYLAFSGRHHEHSVWILTQKYNSVLTDFREQLKWIAIFYCKDRDSFNDCLKENDVIQDKEIRSSIRKRINETKYAKLILRTEQPTDYCIHI